jgi:hypothetical protein
MPSVARVTYIPLKALATNVIAIFSRSRRKRRKRDSMTTVPLFKPLYLDELAELRRTMLRYARSFPPGAERNQHLQIAVSLRRLFRNEKWAAAHIIEGSSSQSDSMSASRSACTRWRLRRPAFFSRDRAASTSYHQ